MRMKKLSMVLVGIATGVLLLAGQAMATAPTPGGGWTSATIVKGQLLGPWTISLAVDSFFDITDAYVAGDYFEVFDWGSTILLTPAVPVGGLPWDGDPDSTWLDAGFSSGRVFLGAGLHSIIIYDHGLDLIPSPSSPAGFFTRIPMLSPEPATLFLLGSGLLGLVGFGRKKKEEEV